MYGLMILMCVPLTMHAGKVVCADSDWTRIAGYQSMQDCKWAADSVATKHKVIARCEATPDYAGTKLKD